MSDQWDEATRGNKMSNATGRVIFKYQMPVMERFTMRLPRGAEVIAGIETRGTFQIWAAVDTHETDETRHFVAIKRIGIPVPNGVWRKPGCSMTVHEGAALFVFDDRQDERNCPIGKGG